MVAAGHRCNSWQRWPLGEHRSRRLIRATHYLGDGLNPASAAGLRNQTCSEASQHTMAPECLAALQTVPFQFSSTIQTRGGWKCLSTRSLGSLRGVGEAALGQGLGEVEITGALAEVDGTLVIGR